MWSWLLAVLGFFVGGAVGLVGPVFALMLVGVVEGSYEMMLPVWLVTLPVGVVLGAVLGFVLGKRIDARRKA